MDWFNITGTTLGFVGSVIFSAGLLKGSQQIKDENAAYWGRNPYTSKNESSSQKYNQLAFSLLISGFAVIIGGLLSENIRSNRILIGILISTSLTSTGFLLSVLLYNHRIRSHDKLKTEVLKGNFRRSVSGNKLNMKKKADLDAQTYKTVNNLRIKSLEDTLSQIPTEFAVNESALLQEFKVATTVAEMIDSSERFLEETKPKSK